MDLFTYDFGQYRYQNEFDSTSKIRLLKPKSDMSGSPKWEFVRPTKVDPANPTGMQSFVAISYECEPETLKRKLDPSKPIPMYDINVDGKLFQV